MNGDSYDPFDAGRLVERVETVIRGMDELKGAIHEFVGATNARLARLEADHAAMRGVMKMGFRVWGCLQACGVVVLAWWLSACQPEARALPHPCREAAEVTAAWIELADVMEQVMFVKPHSRDEAQALAAAMASAVDTLRELDAQVRAKTAECLS